MDTISEAITTIDNSWYVSFHCENELGELLGCEVPFKYHLPFPGFIKPFYVVVDNVLRMDKHGANRAYPILENSFSVGYYAPSQSRVPSLASLALDGYRLYEHRRLPHPLILAS